MKYLHDFQNHDEMNEGLKSWISTFLILAGLGLVPPSIAQGQNRKQQKEFVENLERGKIDGALFVDYLNKLDINRPNLSALFDTFKIKNPSVKSNFKDVEKYINRSGKEFMFNQSYISHDYSNVDITKFQPENWLTDMGNMIEDSKEPDINNWISNYEKQTSIEIGIITIKKLPEDFEIDEYALQTFRRIGVGKKGANNGLLVVLSKEDRKWRITTGYGLEGVLTDADCRQIAENELVPFFKEGDYYGGIMALLEKVKSKVGTEEIELKKEFLAKKRIADEQASREFWDSFWEVTIQALIIILALSIIGYAIYKRQKKIKEMRMMKENIDKILSDIDGLKSKLPSSAGITGSKSLNSKYEACKNYFNSISTQSPKNTKEFEEEISGLYSEMYSLFRNYRLKYDEVGKLKSSIGDLNKIEMSAYGSIEKAVKNVQKINDYGYEIDSIPNNSEVASLSSMIPQITSLLSSDLDEAILVYKKYTSGISKITSKSDSIATKLGSIENAISRVKNWETEVSSLMSKFRTASGDQDDLKSLISRFKEKLTSTKDWFKLSKELDVVIAFMEKAISKYEDELREKREEEERERRRKREEESRRQRQRDEDDRRSSSSSSSSSFGGGSSGGGGASGSW